MSRNLSRNHETRATCGNCGKRRLCVWYDGGGWSIYALCRECDTHEVHNGYYEDYQAEILKVLQRINNAG